MRGHGQLHLRPSQSRAHCGRAFAVIPDHLPGGPRDQSEVEKRKDVLVYSTEALTKDTEVTGPVALDLFARASTVDTDFTAKLVDVWPNGFAQNLTEGILRARFRDGTGHAEPLEPGKV